MAAAAAGDCSFYVPASVSPTWWWLRGRPPSLADVWITRGRAQLRLCGSAVVQPGWSLSGGGESSSFQRRDGASRAAPKHRSRLTQACQR